MTIAEGTQLPTIWDSLQAGSGLPSNLSFSVGRRELYELVDSTRASPNKDRLTVLVTDKSIAVLNRADGATLGNCKPLISSSIKDGQAAAFWIHGYSFDPILRGRTAQLTADDRLDDATSVDFSVVERLDFPTDDDQVVWLQIQSGRIVLHRKAAAPDDIPTIKIPEHPHLVPADALANALGMLRLPDTAIHVTNGLAWCSSPAGIGRVIEDPGLVGVELNFVAGSALGSVRKTLRGYAPGPASVSQLDGSVAFIRDSAFCLVTSARPAQLPDSLDQPAHLSVQPQSLTQAISSILAQTPEGTRQQDRWFSIRYDAERSMLVFTTEVVGGIAEKSCPVIASDNSSTDLRALDVRISAYALQNLLLPLRDAPDVQLHVRSSGKQLMSKQQAEGQIVRTLVQNIGKH
jgi:hypothetical protein